MPDVALTSVVMDPLVQMGVAGCVIAYCFITDFLNRKYARQQDAERVIREDAREKACVARIQVLEDRYNRSMHTVISRNNQCIDALADALRDRGINLKTPLPEITPFAEEETRVIHRKDHNGN